MVVSSDRVQPVKWSFRRRRKSARAVRRVLVAATALALVALVGWLSRH
jgi:hypothetical protein